MANEGMNLAKLAKAAFTDEAKAVDFMIALRWPNGVACPRCGGADPYRINRKGYKGHPPRRGLFKCSQCRKQFTVTTGTVFESTHVPLSRWLMALHLMAASKKGMSAHQLHRMLGITYRAAWFVMHRLRYAMAEGVGVFSKLSGTVEVDETFIGGRTPRVGRYSYKRKSDGKSPYSSYHGKIAVMALVERGGRAKAFPLKSLHSETMRDALVQNLDPANTHMMTDEFPQYPKAAVAENFKKHEMINHTRKEYVRGIVHTNTVEGFFALLKRGIVGTFHVSRGHLHRYCEEFAFRYSNRIALGIDDGQRAAKIVLGAEGKRLTFKRRSGTRAA